MITTCNVLWSLGVMDGCVFNREDIPGSGFGRRILPCDRSTISVLRGRRRIMPRVSEVILLHPSWQTLIFEDQPSPCSISLIFHCHLLCFMTVLSWVMGIVFTWFQTQYVFVNLKSSWRHLALWTVYFSVFFFSWSSHFYMGPFLEIKHLDALGLLSPPQNKTVFWLLLLQPFWTEPWAPLEMKFRIHSFRS